MRTPKERMERGKVRTRGCGKINRQSPTSLLPLRGLCPGEKCLPHQGRVRASSSLPQGRRELVLIGIENKDIQASEP